MVLQSTASLLCMVCTIRTGHPTRTTSKICPRPKLRRWLHRTRDRLAQLSCCSCCCSLNVAPGARARRTSRSHCRPTYGRSASYPGRRSSFGTFAVTAPVRRRRSAVATDGWRVRKISASGRYIPRATGGEPFGKSSSWPGRRLAIRVRDRSIVAQRLRSGDPHGRQIRCTPDWSENAVSGDHLWVPTSVSGDCCYVGDNDCT
uniref:Uncharacterized protein n=1 Tax=Anopheles maculatus TaxID=74869 RepID=A0A182T5B5_9DIPT